jgi:hypothetical protein
MPSDRSGEVQEEALSRLKESDVLKKDKNKMADQGGENGVQSQSLEILRHQVEGFEIEK